MGCGRTTQLVQIEGPRRVASTRPAKSKPALAVIHTHCNRCGFSSTVAKSSHVCQKNPPLVSYQEDRRAICATCPSRSGKVCKTLYAEHGGSKPAILEVGIVNPGWRCPEGKWRRCYWRCDKCGSHTFDERGLASCPVCLPESHGDKVTPRPSPPLPIHATSKRVLVSIAAGQQALDIAHITWPQMRAYASRLGADFVGITNNTWPRYPLGNKWRLSQFAQHYERLVFLDADVWLRDDAPDLFAVSPGVHMLPEGKLSATARERTRKMAAIISQEQHIDCCHAHGYNSGVVVWDRSCDPWQPPRMMFTPHHLYEQVWVELQAKQINPLTPEQHGLWYIPEHRNSGIVHLAGYQHKEKLAWLKRLAAGRA